MPAAAPFLSVVVATRNRVLRLRWLLNALERQTLDQDRWEVVVVHDASDRSVEELLHGHALAAAGVLRAVAVAPGVAGQKRNVGWRLARAPSIVFTHDDCRPPEDWLANTLDAVRRRAEAIVEGPVAGDPDEASMRHAPFWRTHDCTEVPTRWARSWNIVYPRALLDREGGFSEDLARGEDIEIARADRRVGDPGMLTFHAIEDRSLEPWFRAAAGLRDLALVFKRRPDLRRELYLGLFWKRSHAGLPLAFLGLGLQRRRPLAVLLVIPWAVLWEPRHDGIRGRVRHLMELPGWALIDLSELVTLIASSIRYRTVVL
jgi:hypothetical protein